MRQALAELKAREDEVGREWDWLQQAINAIARARADQGDAQAFRLMQQQAMRVGQRRVGLRMRMAELEGQGRLGHHHLGMYPK